MWMKLVKNELFIEKNWVKIAVGISFYCWKTKLVVGSKSGRNLIIGSSHSRWGSILVVGSHPTSIWTIRRTWNWPLELGQNLNHRINVGKLGVVRLAVGARRRFFQKIGEINWNKRKFPQNFPIGGNFFSKNHQYLSFYQNLWIFLPSTFHSPLSFRWLPKHQISPKFQRKKPTFSTMNRTNPCSSHRLWTTLSTNFLPSWSN